MAGLAVTRDANVIHFGTGEGHEVGRPVANLTRLASRHVSPRLTRRVDVVVATHAIVRYPGMVVVRGTPRQRHQMARAAFRRRRNVIRAFPDRLHAVVAGGAGAEDVDMIKLTDRLPAPRRMAGLAVVRRQHMAGRLR